MSTFSLGKKKKNNNDNRTLYMPGEIAWKKKILIVQGLQILERYVIQNNMFELF